LKVSELQVNSRLYPLQNQNIQGPKPGTEKGVQESVSEGSFSSILQSKLDQGNEVKFSAHAIRRMEERHLDLNAGTLDRLNQGMRDLDAKGSVNSLIMMDETAFVVSVKNKTVVTAVDKMGQANNVFTNIDSVAIV